MGCDDDEKEAAWEAAQKRSAIRALGTAGRRIGPAAGLEESAKKLALLAPYYKKLFTGMSPCDRGKSSVVAAHRGVACLLEYASDMLCGHHDEKTVARAREKIAPELMFSVVCALYSMEIDPVEALYRGMHDGSDMEKEEKES